MHRIVRTARELVTSYKWSSLAGGLAALALMGTATVAALSGAPQQPAGRSADNIWQVLAARPAADADSPVNRIAGQYSIVTLNKAAFDAALGVVARDTDPAAAGVLMSLPMPDGTFQRFVVKDSPILSPELAAAFPEIRTFSGQGVDDPTSTARFGWTVNGFHSIHLSGQSGTTYIDPYNPGDTNTYVVFNKAGMNRSDGAWICEVTGEHIEALHRTENSFPISHGTQLRTYRMALAATAEYTAASGSPGTIETAVARITATMNRVNGIYERELSVRMTVATGPAGGDPTALIFTNSATDPYTNNSGGAMLTENHNYLTTNIGTANYDLGHVFSTGGGGVAYLGSVCSAGFKGGGVTGSNNPTGDAFDVDYVAHEVGHQFGGNHTYNGAPPDATSCLTRAETAAYEPASGVTIQAYAGICGTQNLQPNSIDRFHIKSLDEMTAFLTEGGGSTCGTPGPANANTPPVINNNDPLPNFTIPTGTPFTLSTSATDANNDSLTYAWEQFDLGATATTTVNAATTDQGNNPLFRSYAASTSPQRYFPSATYILNNANTPPATYNCGFGDPCVTGEVLPTTARTMNFQVTVRDNRSGGGAFSTARMTVTTVDTGAPFAVTSQNTAPPDVAAGSPMTVTWNVAGTGSGTTVNAANVSIRLSTDGGLTFPTSLSDTTANDGTEQVTIPANALTTAQARIMVQAVGNIFFDVNDANFAITGGSAATAPTAPAKPTGTVGNGSVNLSWVAPANGGSAITGYQVQQSTNANSGFANVASNICPMNTTTTSCNITGLTNGTQYFFKVAAINSVGTSAFSPATDPLTPNGGGGGSAPSTPAAPTGTAGNGSVSLSWTAPANGGSPITGYQVQQSTSADSGFANVATNICPINNTATSCNVTGLTNGTPYFFKVAAINTHGTSSFSPASSSITPVAPCSYVLSPDSASVDRLVSNETITVTAGTGCAWTATVATDSTSMLTISTGASGTGNGTVAYQVTQNPSTTTARTGTMTIAGQTFTVTQSADSYTVDITVQVGSTPVAGAFVALIGTGSARAGFDGATTAGDGTTAFAASPRKFGAVSSSTGVARFRGVTPGTFTMKAHSGGRAVTSGSITVSPTTLSATLSMTSSSSALTTLGAYGAQTGTIVADGQTGVFYLNTTAIPSLFRTTDHGGNWSPVTLSSDDPATGLDASSTAGSPTTSGRGGEIATVVGNKVWYSFDFGLTWASMNSPTGLGGTPQMYWAHIADTTSTVSQLFFTSSSSASVHVADMTAPTPAFSPMAASYKSNPGDHLAVGNGDSAPVIAVFNVSTGDTKFWVVSGAPPNTDASVTVAGLSPTTGTNSAATALLPSDVTLFKIGGPATGVEIVVGTTPVRAPNTVLLYSLKTTGPDTPASNARMSKCTVSSGTSSCSYPLSTVFKNANDTTSATSTFANPGVGEVSLCSANFGAVGSISPLGGAGSVGQCWLTLNGTTSLDVRGVLGVNNNTGMAFDAAYDGTTNLVIISGDGQHGASKSARMTTGGDHFDFGVNRPYFPTFPTIAGAGTGSSTGGIAVQGITSAVIRQSLYQPSSATNMASVMSFSGGGRTIGSTDGGATWFTLVDRGGSRMDWWNGATAGSQWMVLGTGGAGNWMYGTKLAAAADFADTTSMTSVMNGSSAVVGPTDFSMVTNVITSPGVYGVKGISGTDYVGLGSYDGAKLRIDLAPLTFSTPTVTLGTLIPLLEVAIPDPFVPDMAGDAPTANAATGTNAGQIRMAYCPTSGSHASVADALFVAMAAINTGDTGQLRKITGIGAGAALSTPSFTGVTSSSLTVPAGSNLRDIAVNCADGTVWLARSSQSGGGGTPVSGLLKSTDGGTTIAPTVMPTSGNAVTALQNIVAVDFNRTTTTQVVVVSRQGDVLVSDDSAGTWRLVNDTSQAACTGSTTQCGRGFGGEEPGSFAMPPAVTGDQARTSADGAPMAAAATPSGAGVLGSGAGLFQVQVAAAVTPTITGTPATLRFAATKNGAGGELVAVTGSQPVTVTYTGSTAPNWTATSNQTWAVVSNGTGTGAGTFSVSISNPSNIIAGQTSLSATITLTAANTGASTTVAVQLTVTQQTGTTTAPTGQVDTPAQNTTGAQGAIGMTGWVVDDVGIQHVRIYRQCLSIDNPAACADQLGVSVVFVGTASIISGARPDVEALFPTLPAANSAGWGFLILSNLLPNIPLGNASGGGVGTYLLYAIATDQEGNQRLLGRSYVDTVPLPTTVTVANDTIAKPFGAIDTPAQGATVSGTLNNFGWALTPDSNTVADGTDILVPVAGTSINVVVDGASVGTATFNLCRGTVGNPVPSGTLCDDDVSTIFRGAGLYRNLDAARGPIGLRTINTATLSNGLHTIQWGVSDSASRGEGIGSRYFNVLNSSADAAVGRPALEGRQDRGVQDHAALLTSGYDATKPIADVAVYGRSGFNFDRAFVPVEAVAGVPAIVIPELGRVELEVPGAIGVVQLANGSVRSAPVGMSVSAETGTVAWSVGPGYLGTYRLRVEREDDYVVVDVTVAPMALVEEPVRMHLDRADQHGAVFTLHGWALDPQSDTGSGIGAVHVWAKPRSAECGVRSAEGVLGAECEPVFLGVADLGVSRPDVAAAHGARFPQAGFSFQGALGDGEWEITAYIWNIRTQRFEDARTVTITVK